MFIHLVGDGDANAMTPQISPNASTAIGLVAHHATWPVLRAASAPAFDRTTRHERFKPNGFMPLTRCQYERHQLFLTRRAQMDFGAEAALAAT